jgi:hypothetical protein
MQFMDNQVNNRLKRLKNNYLLTVTNDDTYEEVVKFKINRLSVYIGLSSIFVLMVMITVSLIIFTPLKYYLPGVGYGNIRQVKEFKQLKLRTDSMENALKMQIKFNEDIKSILNGKVIKLDTNSLKMPQLENIDD